MSGGRIVHNRNVLAQAGSENDAAREISREQHQPWSSVFYRAVPVNVDVVVASGTPGTATDTVAFLMLLAGSDMRGTNCTVTMQVAPGARVGVVWLIIWPPPVGPHVERSRKME